MSKKTKDKKKERAGFPAVVYLKREADGSTSWFVCGETPEDLPFEVGEGAEIGRYTFCDHVHAEAVVKLGDAK